MQGDVRVDDAYQGGERTGGKAGRGSENKVAFVAAVEMVDGRPQRVRFDPVAGFSFVALAPGAKSAIASGSCVLVDGLLGFDVLERPGYKHMVILASKGKAGTENLNTALSGTHHAFKFTKYAQRYLADAQYRFNRRFDLAAMVPRLAVAGQAPVRKESLRSLLTDEHKQV